MFPKHAEDREAGVQPSCGPMQEMQETQETQVQSLGWEDPLEKEMASHSSILAWRIPWMRKGTPLASRVAQGVSGPSSSCVWNQRVFADDASIESVMPSSHLILYHPLLLLPPVPPNIRVFSNESILLMRWQSTGVSALAWKYTRNPRQSTESAES